MKKIISKILIILIVFLLLFDFIFASQYRCVYAVGGPGKSIVDSVTNLAGGIVAIIYTLLKALIVGLTYGVQVLTTVTASVEGINTDDNFWKVALDTAIDPITPIDIFFNKYKLLDINFFDFEGLDKESYIYLFRISVAEWYAIMKLISCAILLVILIYVGIRMALSTIADDKAKYKKMLADWIVSLVLIFVLQYIIIFTIYCNDAIIKALKAAFTGNDMSRLASESVLKVGLQGIVGTGIVSFASVLVYIFIVFQTIIFLLAYMKRMVKVGFLIIISPLISITYSIDKMGDGKAQALGNWLKEFVYTILIQPFHCIMYLALVETAINLLRGGSAVTIFDVPIFNTLEYNQLAAGVLAIMCLKFVNDGEQVVRKIFGFQDDGSTGMGAGAAIGLAAIANAQKLGGAARKSVNNFKAKGQKIGNALGKDFSKFNGTKLGGAIDKKVKQAGNFAQKTGNAVGNKANQFGNWAANTGVAKAATSAGNYVGDKANKFGKWVGSKGAVKKAAQIANAVGRGARSGASWVKDKAIKGANSNIGKYVRRKSSLSTALGIMGAAMAYSSGSKSALDAVATGTALQKGSQEFFCSSTGSVARDDAKNHAASEAYEHKRQIDDKIATDTEGNKGFSEDALKAISAYGVLDRYNQKQEELKQKRDELKSAENDADKEKLKEEIENLEEETEDMSEDVDQAKDDIEKYDADGNLRGYGATQFTEWKDSAEKKFNDERKSRFLARRNRPDTKKLDDVKNQIIAQLRAAKKEDKGGSESTELTVDEEETISSTAQLLMDKIALGTLNNRNFGAEEQKKLVIQNLGLNKDGDNHIFKGVTDFSRATEKYEDLARQSQIADNHRHVRSYDETKKDIASNSLVEREYKDYIDSLPKEQREKTSDES